MQDYRCQIDAQVQSRLDAGDLDDQALQHLQLGLQHEQQHQELLLTDIKHAFWCNPLQPAYREDLPTTPGAASAQGWIESPERIVTVGAASWPHHAVFAYDNESPPHRVLLPAHALAERPLSNAEYRAFIDAGGYREPRWWLSEGWALRETEDWQHPLYWDDTLQREYTLGGWRELDPHAPVCHLSYFEADACARWAGARLPSEFEWEAAAASQPVRGHFADDDHLHPQVGQGSGLRQLFGDVWEWTHSAYGAYPASAPLPATSASTTANSCVANGCCAAAAVPRPVAMCAPATATSSCHRRVGSSPACAWPGICHEHGARRAAGADRSHARSPADPF